MDFGVAKLAPNSSSSMTMSVIGLSVASSPSDGMPQASTTSTTKSPTEIGVKAYARIETSAEAPLPSAEEALAQTVISESMKPTMWLSGASRLQSVL